ncbi:MAG: hypothetical protein CR982_09395 [Candidatus Cloacimonadota bacterium]|nr:MAG: hypothetical protein CR982_09395 [Candidatus Cloacimonadota bacterium]PIE77523.1 MAG: hypothetical protein CSA15_12685 [Candidatus Delongbacteria bacterium]
MSKKSRNMRKTVFRRVFLSVFFIIAIFFVFLSIEKIKLVGANLAERPMFTVKNYIVKGNRILKKSEIVNMLNFDSKQIFDIDNKTIEDMIEKSPFIDSVRVEKRYPSTLFIEVNEFEPYALRVDKNNMLYFVNIHGEIMGEYRSGDYNLPTIRNNIDIDLAISFLKYASKSKFMKYKISEILYSKKGLSFLLTDNSVNVIVGNDNFEKKIIAFQDFYKKYFDQLDYNNIKSIDLRFPYQIVVDNKKNDSERKL